jgi:hypothetical protein
MDTTLKSRALEEFLDHSGATNADQTSKRNRGTVMADLGPSEDSHPWRPRSSFPKK